MSQAQIDHYLASKADIEKITTFPANFRELLRTAADKYGDNASLNFFEQGDGIQLSFNELYQRVNQVADGLNSIGIHKGSHVALMLTNRIEFPITWLALACLGAIMVPVNVTYTGKELDYLINDSDTDFIVTEDKFLPVFADMKKMPARITPAQQVLVTERNDVIQHNWHHLADKGEPSFVASWPIDKNDLLNIQYTSGTTGFPKGCMQTQNYWILLGCVVAHSTSGKIENILTDHSFFYMDPQWQLVMSLYVGARLNVAGRLSSSQFIPRIKKWNIDFAWFPRPLLSAPANEEDKNLGLKKMFIGGASGEAIASLQERFGIQVSNAYGMTEIGPGLIVPEEVTDPKSLGTCGLVAPFRECKIMLEGKSEAPLGEAGELWIRGDGIFKGYYNKPEANADSFVDGWFRTGDKFIQTPEGYYKIIGRFKDMIRRSSENISALEVEYALNQHPQVRQSAVVPVPDDYRGEEVKAYIQLREGYSKETLTEQQIISHCEQNLASFKVPRYIEYVTELPLTPTEKVAKQKLIQGVDDLTANCWDKLAQ